MRLNSSFLKFIAYKGLTVIPGESGVENNLSRFTYHRDRLICKVSLVQLVKSHS